MWRVKERMKNHENNQCYHHYVNHNNDHHHKHHHLTFRRLAGFYFLKSRLIVDCTVLLIKIIIAKIDQKISQLNLKYQKCGERTQK